MSQSDQLNNLREELKVEIRALLWSSKDGMTDNELKREYGILAGYQEALLIKIHELGYNYISDYMKTLGDFVEIKRNKNNGLNIYYGKPDEGVKDLLDLVHGQVDRREKDREEFRSKEAFYRSRSRNRYGSNEYLQNKLYQNSMYRSHSQSNHNDNLKIIPSLIVKQIQGVLLEHTKLKLKDFEDVFKSKYGYKLDSELFGFSSSLELFQFLKNLIRVDFCHDKSSFYDEYYVSLLDKPVVDVYESQSETQKSNDSVFTFKDSPLSTSTKLNSADKNNNNINGVFQYPSVNKFEKVNFHEQNQQKIETNLSSSSLTIDLTNDIEIKTKNLILTDFNAKGIAFRYNLFLISLNKKVLVHWTQIANLFGMNKWTFKIILDNFSSKINNQCFKIIKQEEKIDNSFIQKIPKNSETSIVFDLIEKNLDIKLKVFDEEKETCLILYEKIFECCDCILEKDSEHSSQVKSIITQVNDLHNL